MDTHIDAGSRLDNLPLGKFHRRLIILVGLGMFWDAFDNKLSAAVLASMLPSGFSTLELNSLFLSFTFAGLAIGAAFAGWLSDRVGRGFAFQFNLGLFAVLALCAALAPNMEILIALRFLMSIGMGAEYVICYGMITEFIPRARRGRYLGILGFFGGLGVTVSAVSGWLVIPAFSWRAMFVIGGVGALVAWWLRRSMPESPRWLQSRGRYEEAEAVMREIERQNGTPNTVTQTQSSSDATSTSVDENADWVPITVLFSRPVIARTAMALFLTVICLFGSNVITGWMPTFFVDQGLTVSRSLGFNAAIMSGYVVGPLLCVLIADRIGRRESIVIFGTLAAIFAGIYPFMQQPVLIVVIGFVLVAMAASFLTMCLGTVPEFFPTAFRFRGGGLTQTVGRVALIFSPFIVLWLYNLAGIIGVILALSGMYVMATLLYVVARVDTSREALRKISEESRSGDGQDTGPGPTTSNDVPVGSMGLGRRVSGEE
ncbi:MULTISPECIES: MFS transporter [unclassified Rhodococcus (in: high G+C Gram-positive bacteria)]|uniref:MFS transporter n=1 Tax=unclassified Rhodococcus (in: high G+C Gram-positive bacteria) TaxID=192944 RepID=UPI0009E962B1|nr:MULTISPECIES: MFS transporter [unclassified Rhodococcus (in: high G+C Gram-positive bacteria)]